MRSTAPARLRGPLKAALTAVLLAAHGAAFAQAPGAVLPQNGFVPDAARGAALFQQHCIECHGRDIGWIRSEQRKAGVIR